MDGPICFVVGARPNFMKVAPVLRALGEPSVLVHTGQHYDDAMSGTFIRELGLPEPDVYFGVGSGPPGEQTAKALIGVERVLNERRPSAVVVAGDVNSTLAGALAAVKCGLPLAHLEAGLRSFDPTMPEEHNRRLTDHVSDLLLTHSESANENLEREGIDAGHVQLVGNTMIDSLFDHVDAAKARSPWARYDVEPHAYALVTLHRPALVDDPRAARSDDRRARGLAAVACRLCSRFILGLRLGSETERRRVCTSRNRWATTTSSGSKPAPAS